MEIDINEKLKNSVLDDFKEQVNTYKDHDFFNMIENRTFILDMIYCLGVSLNEKYKWADGFRRFQKDLMLFLAEHNYEMKKVTDLFKLAEDEFLEEGEMEI